MLQAYKKEILIVSRKDLNFLHLYDPTLGIDLT